MPAFTASDVIAIMALGVAVVGPILTWRVATARNDHETRMAAVTRRQDRRAVLYVDMMTHTLRIEDWARRTHPIFATSTDPAPPAMPDDESMRSLRARIGALGSLAVRDRTVSLNKAAMEFQICAWQLDVDKASPETQPTGKTTMDLWKDLDTARAALLKAVEEMERTINEELDRER